MGDVPRRPAAAAVPESDARPGSLASQLGFGGSGTGNLPRSLMACFLVVVVSLTVPLAVLVWWVVHTVDDEAQYTAALAPLASSPAVQTFVTDKVTDGLLAAAAQSGAASAVPAATLRPLVETQVAAAVGSPSFAAVWSAAVAASHTTIDAALEGRTTPGSRVTLDLTPVAAAAIANLDDQGDTAFDGVVAATGQPHVVVTLFPTAKLRTVRSLYSALRTARWVLPVVALAAAVGAVLLAPFRRRVLIGLAVGCAVVSGLTVLLVSVVRSAILQNVNEGGSSRQAAAGAYDALVHYLRFDLVVVLLAAAALLLGVVVWWAVTLGRRRPATRR